MKLYADTPALRTRQALGDVACVLWVLAFVWLGRWVTALIDGLATPMGGIRSAGVQLGDSMRHAQGSISDVPFVGDKLQQPFGSVAGTGDRIVRSSDDIVNRIHLVATGTGLLVAVIPIALGVVWWVSKRVAFVRSAALTQRFLDADADLDLFALRAIASQPLARLDRVSHDPAGAWRRQDADVIRRLAALELRDAGLRPPAEGVMSARAYEASVRRSREAGDDRGR